MGWTNEYVVPPNVHNVKVGDKFNGSECNPDAAYIIVEEVSTLTGWILTQQYRSDGGMIDRGIYLQPDSKIFRSENRCQN